MVDLLKSLKEELGIDLNDTSFDNKLNHQIKLSKIKIDNYLRLKTDFSDILADSNFEEKFEIQIVELSKYDYKNSDLQGIKSYTEVKRSVVFDKDSYNTIPKEIKNLLPLPSVRMW